MLARYTEWGVIYNNEQIVWVVLLPNIARRRFDAASFLMDMLKQSVPLWKKEFKGDNSEWVAAKASDDKSALKWMLKK